VDLANIDVTRQNVTLATKGSSTLRVDAAQAPFPATLLLCRTTGCGSCTGFDISLFPHNTCLIANPAFGFFSVFISQPSNEGFAFGVYAGPTCPGLGLIPLVNTCFNVNTVGRTRSLVLALEYGRVAKASEYADFVLLFLSND
jgi:hypothetical protein